RTAHGGDVRRGRVVALPPAPDRRRARDSRLDRRAHPPRRTHDRARADRVRGGRRGRRADLSSAAETVALVGGVVWFHLDNLVLVAAQAACVALPAAGLPGFLERFRGGAWALVLPLCIAVVVFGIDLLPESATILSWAALLLIPPGCALALGW